MPETTTPKKNTKPPTKLAIDDTWYEPNKRFRGTRQSKESKRQKALKTARIARLNAMDFDAISHMAAVGPNSTNISSM
jgi:hypothetical protein